MNDFDCSKKWRERFFRYAPLILWIGVVLFASTSEGSMQNTSRIIRPLLIFLFPNAPDETINAYHGFIRKLAHLTEYAILAFWALRTFSTSAISYLRKYWFAISFLLVFAVASLDEYNQSFDSLRTSSIYDVLLDALGGFLMILFFTIYQRIYYRKSFNV